MEFSIEGIPGFFSRMIISSMRSYKFGCRSSLVASSGEYDGVYVRSFSRCVFLGYSLLVLKSSQLLLFDKKLASQ